MRDSSWWIQGQTSEEKSLKSLFLCDSCCGQNVDLDREEGPGGPTIARSLSCACLFAMSASPRSLPRSREREGSRAISKKRQKRSAQVDILCCSFFRCTARRWPVRNELFFINGAVDGTSGERFLTIAFRISSVKYCVYFLVVCLFFPRSRIEFQKKLDEKHKKQTSCPYDRQKRFLQNKRRRADLQNSASEFLIFAQSRLVYIRLVKVSF